MRFCRGNITMPISPGGDTFVIIHGVIDAIILLVLLIGNLIIVKCVWHIRREHKPRDMIESKFRPSLILALNMAVADSVRVFGVVYYLMFDYSCFLYRLFGSCKILCLSRFASVLFFEMTSLYSMIALTVDRYIAIVHGMKYKTYMTSKATYIIIFTAWFLGGVNGMIMFFWNNWHVAELIPCRTIIIVPFSISLCLALTTIIFTIIILGILNWRIHREAHPQDFALRRHSSIPINPVNGHKTKWITVVVALALFVRIPPLLANAMRSLGIDTPDMDMVYGTLLTIYNLSFMVNTVIYSSLNTKIRLALVKLFCNK